MNKNDIADIRKQFKLDNDLLTIKDIFNVYIRKESSEIYHQEGQSFAMLEREQQELFLTNFKKVLSGKLDQKLFEVKFKEEAETQHILHDGLQMEEVDEWQEQMLAIIQKMFAERHYDKDMVITFIRGEYFKPTKKGREEAEESDRDEVFVHPFILCSMNKTEQPKRTLVFDYIEKTFKSNVVVDSIINLTSPIGGFLFPCFTDHAADVNHILYSAGKANKPDFDFIENVLNGEDIITAQEDRAIFEEVVKDVIGDEVDSQTLGNVYEEIQKMVAVEEEDEEVVATLNYRDVERVLKVSGVEDVNTDKVEMAFQKIIDDEKHELKASNIVPKSIKIETKVADISINPKDLKYVKQVIINNKRCLIIEVDEDAVVEGFKLIPEVFFGE